MLLHPVDLLFLVKQYIAKGQMPHMLFHGPAGTGKTTTAVAIANELYSKDDRSSFAMRQYNPSLVLELNASDDRGIDTIREQIKTFASTRSFFSDRKEGSKYIFIFLDLS